MPICINMQVPLGIQLLRENNLNDMSKILENFHKLVPTHDKEGHQVFLGGERCTGNVVMTGSVIV